MWLDRLLAHFALLVPPRMRLVGVAVASFLSKMFRIVCADAGLELIHPLAQK